MLTHIFGSKNGIGDDFSQSDTKQHYFTSLFGQTPLRNRITMATPKGPGDQKLFGVFFVHTRSHKVSASYT